MLSSGHIVCDLDFSKITPEFVRKQKTCGWFDVNLIKIYYALFIKKLKSNNECWGFHKTESETEGCQ